MVDISNENVAGLFLFLEMAFQAKRCVAFVQQSLVHGPVRRMANYAPLPDRFVFIDEWAALLRMTLKAGFVSAEEPKSAAFKPLLNIRRGTLGRDPFVRFMAIAATHLALEHRMMMRQ